MSFNQFVYDIPLGIGKPPIFPADCVVHFRPHSKWEGKEFGFDWLRVGKEGQTGDTKMFGDEHYAKIMGKYKTSTGDVCNDLNGWKKYTYKDKNNKSQTKTCSFKNGADENDSENYQQMVGWYFPIVYTIPWKLPDPEKTPKKGWKGEAEKTNYTYHVPVMTLVEGKKANLELYVEVEPEKALPKKIDVKQHQSDETYLTVSGPVLPKNGKYFVTIECVKEFSEFQYIDALAIYEDPESGKEIEKLCGQLRVVPNDQQAEAKIVFINVQMDIGNGPNTGSRESDEIDKLNYILSQSYTKIFLAPDETISITNIANFNIIPDGNKYKFKNTESLLPRLNRQLLLDLNAKGLNMNKYDDYIKIFLIDEKCSDENDDGISGTTIGKGILLFNLRSAETVAHETLHGLSLHHPFVSKDGSPIAPKALYTYKAKKTENILDYSHEDNNPRYSTWYWQWRVIWDELNIIIPPENPNVIIPFDIIPKDDKYEQLA